MSLTYLGSMPRYSLYFAAYLPAFSCLLQLASHSQIKRFQLYRPTRYSLQTRRQNFSAAQLGNWESMDQTPQRSLTLPASRRSETDMPFSFYFPHLLQSGVVIRHSSEKGGEKGGSGREVGSEWGGERGERVGDYKVGGSGNKGGWQVLQGCDRSVQYHVHWLSSRPMNSSASSMKRMLVLVSSLGRSQGGSGGSWPESPSSRKSSMLNSSSLISPFCEAGPLCSFWRSSISLISWYLMDSGFRVIFRSFLNLGMGLSRSSRCTDDLRDREARELRALWMMSKVGSSTFPSASCSINKIINPSVCQITVLNHGLAADLPTPSATATSPNFSRSIFGKHLPTHF